MSSCAPASHAARERRLPRLAPRRRPSSTHAGIASGSAPASRHSWPLPQAARPGLPLKPSNSPAISASRSARPAASSRSSATAAAYSSPRSSRRRGGAPAISPATRIRSACERLSTMHSSIAAVPPGLLSGRPHRLGERFPAARQLGRDPGRQIRVGPHLADQLADHVRRGDIAGLGVGAQERVQFGHQVNGDPGRPRRRCRRGLRSLVPCLRYCARSASSCSTGGTAGCSAGAARNAALAIPARDALGGLAGLTTSAPRAGRHTRRTQTARSRSSPRTAIRPAGSRSPSPGSSARAGLLAPPGG